MEYENFKAMIQARSLPWYYRETDSAYFFTSWEGPITFECEIFKVGMNTAGHPCDSARITDFETNYKSSAINIS